jgi:hypothetical protein
MAPDSLTPSPADAQVTDVQAQHRDYSYGVWCARPADGDVDYYGKGSSRLSCRPVRVSVPLLLKPQIAPKL